MNTKRFKSALLKNSAVGLISQATTFIFALVTRNLFVEHIGVELLGLNSTLASILGMLSLAELGFQSAIVYNLYKPLHDGTQEKVNSIMNILKIVYRGVGVFFILATLLITPFLKWIITGIDVSDRIILYFWLQSLASACSYFFANKRAILYADQKEYVYKLVDLTCSIIFNVAQCVTLVMFGSYAVYLGLKIIQVVISNLSIHLYCKKSYPYLKKTKLDKENFKKLMGDVRNIFVGKIASYIYESTDNLVISAFVSTVSVGYLVNYTTVTYNMKVLLNSALSPVIPSLGNYLLDERDNYKRERIFLLNTFVRYLIALIIVIPIGVLIEDFISLWIGSGMLLSNSIVVLLCVDLYIHLVHSASCDFISSAGLFKDDKYIEIVGACCNITVSVILVKYLGIAGVLIGTIVSQMVFWVGRSFIVYRKCLNLGRMKYLKYWIVNARKGMFALAVAFIVAKIYNLLLFQNIFLRILVGGLCSEVVIIALVIIVFGRSEEFKTVMSLVQLSLSVKNKG